MCNNIYGVSCGSLVTSRMTIVMSKSFPKILLFLFFFFGYFFLFEIQWNTIGCHYDISKESNSIYEIFKQYDKTFDI